MTFSIIVVCFNAGDKLDKTVASILGQTSDDYEIVVKDGGSTDGSTQRLVQSDKLRLYRQKDTGIYDAMNQAVGHARGEYIFFLNCGDYFYDETVLETVKKRIPRTKQKYLFYGNICESRTGAVVQSNPVIDDFACYRNVPCHQACFYSRELFQQRGFLLNYQVRADYEHFLWCFYREKARMVYMPVTVALYEGDGFSESKENERLSKSEHREIAAKYIPPAKVLKYRLLMLLTLAGLRRKIARSPATAKLYNRLKKNLYHRRG